MTGRIKRKYSCCYSILRSVKTTIKEFREQDLEARREAINFIIRYQQRVEIESGMQVEFKIKCMKLKILKQIIKI